MAGYRVGEVVRFAERLYRVWDVLPFATVGSALICTRPDGRGGWDGERVVLASGLDIERVQGDPRLLAKEPCCARCFRNRRIYAGKVCKPCHSGGKRDARERKVSSLVPAGVA